MLTKASDTAVFEALLGSDEMNKSKIVWKVTPAGGAVTSAIDKDKLSVKALDLSNPATLLVTATYDNKYTSTATIEILPGGITNDKSSSENTIVKLLEKKATINLAKNTGALVPVLITDQKPKTLAVGTAPKTGADLAAKVILIDGKSGIELPTYKYWANMYTPDNRYIEFGADKTAKSISKVNVIIEKDGNKQLAGIIDLAVVEK